MIRMMTPTNEEKERILIGLETVQICQCGYYEKDSRRILLPNETGAKFEQAIPYSPEKLENLRRCDTRRDTTYRSTKCRISVVDKDSFEAASAFEGALVMNFANARRPGGGFLYGAKAQEEALCRASTLYASLSSSEAEEMYRFNRNHPSPVDSDYMILSPQVCVFRNHTGELLDAPFVLSVITVPAPDKAGRAKYMPQKKLDQVIQNRLRNMFAVAACHGYRTLILGAWGCGAFGNDARDMARFFFDVLVTERYTMCFENIVFAISGDQLKLKIFKQEFECAN